MALRGFDAAGGCCCVYLAISLPGCRSCCGKGAQLCL